MELEDQSEKWRQLLMDGREKQERALERAGSFWYVASQSERSDLFKAAGIGPGNPGYLPQYRRAWLSGDWASLPLPWRHRLCEAMRKTPDKSTADIPHATCIVNHGEKEVKPGKQLKLDCIYCGLHFETRAKRRRHERTCERRTDAND